MKSHFQGTFTIIFDNLSAIPVLRDSYQCGYAAKTLETLRNFKSRKKKKTALTLNNTHLMRKLN